MNNLTETQKRTGGTPVPPSRPRLPEWLRIKLPTSDSFSHTRALLDELKLHTVCESAKCPNHWECWSKGTATFMIAGDRCTRACGFCAVTTAKPFALEADEPARVAEATRRMRLKHVVITAVAFYFAVASKLSLVSLLLGSYGGVAQIFPVLIAAFYWPRATAARSSTRWARRRRCAERSGASRRSTT